MIWFILALSLVFTAGFILGTAWRASRYVRWQEEHEAAYQSLNTLHDTACSGWRAAEALLEACEDERGK